MQEVIEFLTSDKGVTKQIIYPGDGEKPPKGSSVAIHYTGKWRLPEGQEAVFDDTYKRAAPLEILVGARTHLDRRLTPRHFLFSAFFSHLQTLDVLLHE